MSENRRQRTPEEIAKSIEIAKQVMNNQKKNDGIAAVTYGKSYIFVAAVYFLIHALFMYSYNSMENLYIFSVLTVMYILLGFVYTKNPFVISIIAFSFFILIIVMQAIVDPVSLFGGIFFFSLKIVVIFGLVASIVNAVKYKRELESQNKKKVQNDILDDGLIEI